MLHTSEIEKLDASYFNIILAWCYDVTLQSKNTGIISICTLRAIWKKEIAGCLNVVF